MKKTWEEEEFNSVKKEINHDSKKIDCPICKKTISENELINLFKNTRHYCPRCQGYFCYFCMQEWKIYYPGYRIKKYSIHHCKEVLIKGKYKKRAYEFFAQCDTFKENYSIYKQEKILLEENLKKMREHLEFMEFKNNSNLEKELVSDACNFYESFIGMINFFLNNNKYCLRC